jgi:hypothetical protein
MSDAGTMGDRPIEASKRDARRWRLVGVNAMANDGAATKKKGRGRAGHHKSSAIDEHLEVAVEEAEKSLLQGQFRQALKDANRCLVYATTTNPVAAAAAADGKGHQRTTKTSDNDSEMEEDGLCVRAPFYFPFVFDDVPHHDRRPRTLCIRIDARPSDQVDRAAAVVLQSWYELSQRISEDSPVVQESHLRLLQPFWRAYATIDDDRNGPSHSSPRSCSLELVVVLVQFCRATFHVRESVELAMATLHHVLSSEDSHQLLARQWHHIHELLVYLFCRLLPYSVNDRSVELALTRLSEPVPCEAADDAQGRNPRPHADDWILSDRTNARAIRILVRFLENPPVHWPEECQGPLEVCREQLEAELARHPPDPRDELPSKSFATSTTNCHPLNALTVSLPAVPVNGIRDAASGQFEGLPTLGWDANGAKLWLCRLSYLAKVAVVEPFALSNQRWSNRGVLAVSLWAFWAAWRRRAKFYRASRLALRAVLQPIREIIEALVTSSAAPPPTRR